MHAHLAALDEEYTKYHTRQEQMEYAVSELNLRRSQGTAAFFSCGNPEEWEFASEVLRRFCEEESGGKCAAPFENGDERVRSETFPFWLSFGIHPWYSDGVDITNLCEMDGNVARESECAGSLWALYKHCAVIGEIGMDSVWCEIPLDVQRSVFILHKPVILHTKGQEKEIAELIQDFSGKICVHWYSGDIETLEKYMKKDCYFTLGPDIGKAFLRKSDCSRADRGVGLEAGFSEKSADAEQEDKASAELYRYMLEHIPTERLFLETDGISAVAWARGVDALPQEAIPAVLNENVRILAKCKGMSEQEIKKRIWVNLSGFLE